MQDDREILENYEFEFEKDKALKKRDKTRLEVSVRVDRPLLASSVKNDCYCSCCCISLPPYREYWRIRCLGVGAPNQPLSVRKGVSVQNYRCVVRKVQDACCTRVLFFFVFVVPCVKIRVYRRGMKKLRAL